MNLSHGERRVAKLLISNGRREKVAMFDRVERELERQAGIGPLENKNFKSLMFRHEIPNIEGAEVEEKQTHHCTQPDCKFWSETENGLRIHLSKIHGIRGEQAHTHKAREQAYKNGGSKKSEISDVVTLLEDLEVLQNRRAAIEKEIEDVRSQIRQSVDKI